MIAIIRRGKDAGEIVTVLQWCNDWFSVNHDRADIAKKVFLPSGLLFNEEGIEDIQAHKKNGKLFEWFKIEKVKRHTIRKATDDLSYCFSFSRIRKNRYVLSQY